MRLRKARWNPILQVFEEPDRTLVIQAPLPLFNTRPKIGSIARRGSGRQGPSPSAPPGRLRHA